MPGVAIHGKQHFSIKARGCEFNGFANNLSRIICGECSDLLNCNKGFVENKEFQKSFHAKIKRWTMAWLDFTSQLSDAMIASLQCIPDCLDDRRNRVPVAVTFMLSRESPKISSEMDLVSTSKDVLQKRVDLICACQAGNRKRDIVVLDAWKYRSQKHVTMGTALLLYVNKSA